MIKLGLAAIPAFACLLPGLLAAQQPALVAVDEAIQAKKLVKRVEPVYPENARYIPVRGPIVLDVMADEKGEVVSVKLVRGGNPVVQKPVCEAVKKWRYSPTYVDGRPVSVKFRVTVPVVMNTPLAGCNHQIGESAFVFFVHFGVAPNGLK